MYKQQLLDRLTGKHAHIGVFGLGYVGLPLALSFAEAGYPVTGFDIDPEKVDTLNSGRTYLSHIPPTRVSGAIQAGFRATANVAEAKNLDAIIICVPTPLSRHREPDLSFVTGTVQDLLPHLKPGQALSLESTTYPGTTEEVLQPLLETRGLTIGEDFFLLYSPEREDPGNPHYTTRTIPKVCGGITTACLEVGQALYSGVVDTVVPVSSTKTAEMTKLLENIYRAVNIGLVNEMKIVADKMGINIHEVIDAAATKPFGFTKFTPGPGLGGHCIPIDPYYLTWKAREHGINTRFIELSGEVNRAMPDWVVQKTADALNERGKPLKGSKILILGLAYKKNVSDSRESPAVEILDKLMKKGALVDYSDPHVPTFPKKRHYNYRMNSVALSPDIISDFDCIVLITDHDDVNYAQLIEHATLVVDTRNRLPNGRTVVQA